MKYMEIFLLNNILMLVSVSNQLKFMNGARNIKLNLLKLRHIICGYLVDIWINNSIDKFIVLIILPKSSGRKPIKWR